MSDQQYETAEPEPGHWYESPAEVDRYGEYHETAAETDQIEVPLAGLTDAERTEARARSMLVTCYVGVDVCGGAVAR